MELDDPWWRDWSLLHSLLPGDLELTAKACGALHRRRAVASEAALLKLILEYTGCRSLNRTKTEGLRNGWLAEEITDEALFKRLVKSEGWLQHLVLQWLFERGLTRDGPPVKARVVDACVRPNVGDMPTRLWLRVDLESRRMDRVIWAREDNLVQVQGDGPDIGEVLLIDCAEQEETWMWLKSPSTRPGRVVVRVSVDDVQRLTGRPLPKLRTLRRGECHWWPVTWRGRAGSRAGRAIAIRHTSTARKRQTIVLTDLAEEVADAGQVLELHRLGWQIRRALRCLNFPDEPSPAHFSPWESNAKLAKLARLGWVLRALIEDDLRFRSPQLSPWGYRLRRV